MKKTKTEILIEKLRGASPSECGAIINKLVKIKTKGEKDK